MGKKSNGKILVKGSCYPTIYVQLNSIRVKHGHFQTHQTQKCLL